MAVVYNPTRFHENSLKTLPVILCQSGHTDGGDYSTLLAEVNYLCKYYAVAGKTVFSGISVTLR